MYTTLCRSCRSFDKLWNAFTDWPRIGSDVSCSMLIIVAQSEV